MGAGGGVMDVALTCSARHAVYAMCAAKTLAELRGEPLHWLQHNGGTWSEYWQRHWPQLRPLIQAQPWCESCELSAEVSRGVFADVPLWGWSGSVPSWYLGRVHPSLKEEPWLHVPEPVVSDIVFVSWKPLSLGRRYDCFPWSQVIGDMMDSGLRVRWIGAAERYEQWQAMTGCALASCGCVDLLQAARRIAGGRGYLGSPGVYAALAAGVGQRRVLVSHATSCEHWSAEHNQLSEDGEGVSEWLLAG